MYAGYERNSETFQKGSKFHDTFISVLHPHILEHWPGSLSFCWLLCFCTYNYFNPPAHRRMFKLHRTWTNMTSRTDRTSSTNSNSTASSDEPHTDSESTNCTITRGPKIHVLQPSSPTKFARNPLSIFNKRKKSEQVALLIGTEQSGKRSLMESINYMDTELEIISLSNDIAISNYHNFLYGVNSIIFVMDSAKLSVEYLDRKSLQKLERR
ncbi:hypothetical protein BN1211_4370 [Cyberlindnera jadinii]|uniref:Uncharacterized protein n=1 Tax=Cyberlindnera jadinii (strain ATCC 18201 / CBS 1600 / BCRC 20928 / JCM 3617 / NBRC 0987 / NRRL Y-1542) TaxID=983966 RepID=A0A0H5CGP6_CYBJN|nr:hypothetical protein BN1211_4370 [Cyberlindnera jadinii]